MPLRLALMVADAVEHQPDGGLDGVFAFVIVEGGVEADRHGISRFRARRRRLVEAVCRRGELGRHVLLHQIAAAPSGSRVARASTSARRAEQLA